MREIKFRVWDNIAKKYIDSRYVSISGLGLLHVAKCIIKTCFRPLHTRKNPWFIVEQYTGLKDKNGTEIFEGDIVKYYPHHRGVPYRVYWADKSAKFLIGRDGVIGQSFSDIMHNLNTGRIALEVVGNIHENPELLEEK